MRLEPLTERKIAMAKQISQSERAHAEKLLEQARKAQTKLWDLSLDLEKILRCAVDTNNDLENETIDSIIERNEEI
jgi:hypothetical protein